MEFLGFILKHRLEVTTLALEHLRLVTWSMALSLLAGIPLGVLLVRYRRARTAVLGTSSVIQTIPSLALFGLLLPIPWLGARADRLTITALALYALLPIVRNTFAGISAIDAPVREAAIGMGLNSRQLLWHVELPLASPV